ncbi:MAG: hypothetical protein HZB13_06430, partial [Acidobacteria bacterium]|nr:hypothetical protein [Acidobacteriota bacterium]
MRRGRLWITLALFAAVFLVHALSPVPASGDSRWTVPTALSLLDRGDLNLDEYQREMTASGYYAIECVSLDRTRRAYPLDTRPDAAAACAGSHHYTVFPLAGPVLSAAVIGPLRWAVVTARPL